MKLIINLIIFIILLVNVAVSKEKPPFKNILVLDEPKVYKEIDISKEIGLRDEMIKKANGMRTIPQIFFDDHHVGGYVELRELEKNGELNNLLK